ncbi:MAG: M23 family metallopeptidase [Pseudomonadota bacterium]
MRGGAPAPVVRAFAAAILASLPFAFAATPDDLFRWRDGRPLPDRPPTTAPAPAPASTPRTGPIAGLRFETRGDRIEVWADNRLSGPIEVELRPVAGRVAGTEPALPARTVVPALDRRIVARLPKGTTAQFDLDAVHGDPRAQAEDIEYGYPLRTTALQIEQGWGGGYSHRDPENRYGVDFAADIGTDVIAARAGTVMEIEAGFAQAGRDPNGDASRANFVRIAHADGSMALYAHLDAGGVLVREGQRVRKGETIARSGNTGFTTGPHLHFAVQVNRGMRLESIPFRMFGPQGILRFSETR